MRILLVEDDLLIGDGINTGLNRMGFNVDWFKDGTEGMEALETAPYEAVILDLGLPGTDGLSILQNWRRRGHKEPVLILTARGDVNQRIIGLDSGADDYLPKPFALAEVAARLKALIRRRHDRLEPEIRHGNLVFVPSAKQIYQSGQEVNLAPKELQLLEQLLLNPKQIMTKEALEEKLYGWDEDVSSNAVEVHIHHLRRKLGKNIIITVNKIGYRLGDA